MERGGESLQWTGSSARSVVDSSHAMVETRIPAALPSQPSTAVTVPATHSTVPAIILPNPSSQCGNVPAGPDSPASQQYVVEEKTTTVRVPMLRPRPALLRVLQLSGGIGETYTLKEIIGLVQEYIQERKLYDESQPHVVHCGGDLLAQALGVQRFTVMEALGLFHRNCSLEPDSCIRIRRQLVTRPVSVPASDTTAPGSGVFSTACHSSATNTSSSSALSSVLSPGSGNILPQLCNSDSSNPNIPQNQLPSTPESSGSLSSSGRSSQVSSQKSSMCSSSTMSPQSVSSSGTVLTGASCSSVVVKQSELDDVGEQVVTSTDSCSDLDERKRRSRKRNSDENVPPSSSTPRQRSTSVSVKCDEIDGSSSPWQCEVLVETSAGAAASPEDDTVVVEYGSDHFSVEYEVESSSEHEPQPWQEAQGSRPQRERESSESDISSSTSRTAILLVCKESDVEYLADYSDSDFGSDAELSDADKWHCEHCRIRNPPFQRNCAGCWSVRPDWLPPRGKVMRCQEKSGEDGAWASCKMFASQESGLGSSKSTVKLEEIKDTKLSSLDLASPSKLARAAVKKRKISSSLETSDSQEEKRQPRSSLKKQKLDDGARRSESSTEEGRKVKGKTKASRSQSNITDPCVVCLSRSKTASIIHGKTGHQVCCYRCAKRLKEQRRACPICRRPIQKVVRNYYL